MRAVVADHAGAHNVLTPVTLPDPQPGPGQVLVAVTAAAITFVDTQMRAGTSPGPQASFPAVLGNGVGGTVVRVGHDVDPSWTGTPVVTTTGGHGGYATLAVANVADLHRIPARLALHDATALLADGRTALGLHTAANPLPGQTVAITAAAGGVGTLLVQLAAAARARVVALAGAHDKLVLARDLGAHATVNYREPEWADRMRQAAPDGLDVVFDGVGGATTGVLGPLLRTDGRYLPHGAAGGRWGALDRALPPDRDITVIPLSAIADGPAALFALVEEALALAVSGVFRPIVGQTYPLDEAAAAHAAIEARTTIGKTLLLP